MFLKLTLTFQAIAMICIIAITFRIQEQITNIWIELGKLRKLLNDKHGSEQESISMEKTQ